MVVLSTGCSSESEEGVTKVFDEDASCLGLATYLSYYFRI